MIKNGTNATRVLSIFKKLYPDPHHYLKFENPFQLLVATILSAQCTDEKVN
ncbi:MAG TPA: endonuclease III, partial [Patescibacteria group bacterium]|nr:endonuclease III [Patescibacteria group bacterium]